MSSALKIVPTNLNGRVFFTTDIHGHFGLLHEHMRDFAFDTSKDILLVGGDSIDRHPDSKHILDYINEPWFISVFSNHDQMLCDFWENPVRQNYHNFYVNGGDWFFDLSESHQQAIFESIVGLPLGIEYTTKTGEKVGIVHAEVPRNNWDIFKSTCSHNISAHDKAIALWSRTRYDKKECSFVVGVDRVLSGHTPTASGGVEVLGNDHYCDLGSFFRNKLAFIQID